jgi:hypothetical protein
MTLPRFGDPPKSTSAVVALRWNLPYIRIRRGFAMKKQMFVVALGSLLALAAAPTAWSQGTGDVGARRQGQKHKTSVHSGSYSNL